MANVWKVINTDTLSIRSAAGAWNANVGTLYRGEEITEISKTNLGGVDWVQHSRGWSAVSSGTGNNTTYLQLVSTSGTTSGGGNTGSGTTGGGTSSGSGTGYNPSYGGSGSSGNAIWKVTASYVRIRSSASISGADLGTLSNGETIEQQDRVDSGTVIWIKHARGWSCAKDGATVYMQLISGSSETGSGSSGGGALDPPSNSVPGVGNMNDNDEWWCDITYFTRQEFACKCGGRYGNGCTGYPHSISFTLVRNLDAIRAHFNAPVIINSGLRCKEHNSAVGGVYNSWHMIGRAADFVVSGYSNAAVVEYCKTLPGYDYAYMESSFVHLQVEDYYGSLNPDGTVNPGTGAGENYNPGSNTGSGSNTGGNNTGGSSNPGNTGGSGNGGSSNGSPSGSASSGDGYLTRWRVVNTDSLRIRSGPGLNYPEIGTLYRGEIIDQLNRTQVNDVYWIEHSRGWSAVSSGSDTYLEFVEYIPIGDNQPATPPYVYDDNVGEGAYRDINISLLFNLTNSKVSNSEFVKFKNIGGVFGLPYQFLPNTDIRLSGDKLTENIGSEYAERIIERMPLMLLSPGKANFMTKFSKSQRKSALEVAVQQYNGLNTTSLESLLTTGGKYYTFEDDRVGYYKYVNPMCRIAARYLNIQDVMLNGTKLDNMNWSNYADYSISSLGDFSSFGAIPFYVDAESSISESFGNSTAESYVASSVNSISNMGRELNFLLGYTSAAAGIGEIIDADVAENVKNVNDMVSKLMGSGSFFTQLANHMATVASGGQLIFPEIWADSSFTRSFNCELKFISPDPSILSVYLNVLVPLFHLIGLVAPQSIPANPNGFMNPFLVRAVYKGFFNIDMGIITNMSITKGAECQWTPEGIPTSINVSLTIKDLYSALSITKTNSTDWKYDTLNNTALMDYIANLCGVNIFKPEVGRMMDMWFVNNFENRAKDLFPNLWDSWIQKAQNVIMNIYR